MKFAFGLLALTACLANPPTEPNNRDFFVSRAILMSPDFTLITGSPTGAPIRSIYVDCTYRRATGTLIRCIPAADIAQ